MITSRITSSLENIQQKLGELLERAARGFPIEPETLKAIRSDLHWILSDLDKLDRNETETCGNPDCETGVDSDCSAYITILSLPCRFSYCSLECQEHHTKRLSSRRYTIVNPILTEVPSE